MKPRLHATLTLITLLMTFPSFGQQLDLSSESQVSVRTMNAPSYGLSNSTSVQVQAFSFEAYNAGMVVVPDGSLSRQVSSGLSLLISGVSLPNGALITRLEIQGCDQSTEGRIRVFLYRTDLGNVMSLVTNATSGDAATGCAAFGIDTNPPPDDPVFTVNNRDYSYVLVADIPPSGSTFVFQTVRVFYKLQMGPDPATSSFTDVTNVGTELHRAVENLKASGITAGCGDGTAFCPGSPVTRGQMAIFLARALGLHWPN